MAIIGKKIVRLVHKAKVSGEKMDISINNGPGTSKKIVGTICHHMGKKLAGSVYLAQAHVGRLLVFNP